MKIAFLGLKGLPPRFGGLQFDAENIGERLVRKGHEVTVYCRRWYTGNIKKHKGMDLVLTPTIHSRPTDCLIHGLTSTIHAVNRDFDVVHFFAPGSYFFVPIFKLSRKKTVIRLNGIPWENPSYNRIAKFILKTASIIGIKYADAVTAESQPIKEIYQKKFHIPITVTPVGAEISRPSEPDIILNKFGITTNNFILFLGRLERGKRVDWAIKAFKEINVPDLKLVIAGDTPDTRYKKSLYEIAGNDKRIIFTGTVGGKLKEELLSNCRLFTLPSVSEGMPTAIIESMSYGRCCLVSNIPPHKWIIQDSRTGFLFDTNSSPDFSLKLKEALHMQNTELLKIGLEAEKSVRQRFNWDSIINTIEQVYS